MAANPVNDTRQKAQLLVTYVMEKSQNEDNFNDHDLLINKVEEFGSVSCNAHMFFIRSDGPIKFGTQLHASGEVDNPLQIPPVIHMEDKWTED